MAIPKPIYRAYLLTYIHKYRLNEEAQSEMWYDGSYTECDLLQGWDKILDVTKDKVGSVRCLCAHVRDK